MSLQDPLSDALTMMRNASRAKKEKVDVRFSKILEEILALLKKSGYILNFKKVDVKNRPLIRVYLKYRPEGKAIITELKRISTPGHRVYVSKTDIPKVLGGYGIALLTTSKGIMTDNDARNAGVGGEVLLSAW